VISKRRLQKHSVLACLHDPGLWRRCSSRVCRNHHLPPPMRSTVPRRPSMSPAPCWRTRAKASGTAQSRPRLIAPLPSNSAAREPRNALRSKPRSRDGAIDLQAVPARRRQKRPYGCEGYRLMAERPRPYLRQGIVLYELRSRDSHPQYLQRHTLLQPARQPGPSAQDPRRMGLRRKYQRIIPAKTFRPRPECSLRTPPEVTPARVSNSDVSSNRHCPLRMLRRASHGPHGKERTLPLTMLCLAPAEGSAACSNPVAIREFTTGRYGSNRSDREN